MTIGSFGSGLAIGTRSGFEGLAIGSSGLAIGVGSGLTGLVIGSLGSGLTGLAIGSSGLAIGFGSGFTMSCSGLHSVCPAHFASQEFPYLFKSEQITGAYSFVQMHRGLGGGDVFSTGVSASADPL